MRSVRSCAGSRGIPLRVSPAAQFRSSLLLTVVLILTASVHDPRRVAQQKGTRMATKRQDEYVDLRRLSAPPKFQKPKRIHPRRNLPLTGEGVEREFHSTSTRALLAPLALNPADDVKIVLNSELTEPGQEHTASNVGEPSCAMNGNVVFYTGNWYAAISTDGGKTFGFIDPASTQKSTDPAGCTFCCDQVVHYIPQLDTFVWLLQYGPDTGDNIQRLGFASSADLAAGNLRFRFFDLTTAMLGVPGAFMDFPDVAVGANSLYVTTNVFTPGKVQSAVFRLPLSGIAANAMTVDVHLSSPDLDSCRVVQNCGTTAYFAAHKDTSTLEVFAWPEGHPAPTATSVPVARWIGGNTGYRSRTPDGRRWLDRADPRLTGATMTGKEAWFAWGVDRNSNHRPQPFVQIARIDTTTMTLLENINVFDPDSATCYGALSTNAKNEVGISYMIGGAVFPSHVVGILTGAQRNVIAAASERSPLSDNDGRFSWGDYLTVRRARPDENLFAATGYTLKGKSDSDNRDSTPRFVLFGRASDTGQPAGGDPGGGGTGDTTGPTVSAGPGPITDVNQLTTVSPQVAMEIKKACGLLTPHAAPAEEELPQAIEPRKVTAPGKERWPVKVGTDDDVALVGKNIINNKDLGRGIVETTVEELITIPRPAGMTKVTSDPPGFRTKRARPAELVIWRITARITALKLEDDGDYHLVLQGSSGEMMIGEVPTPTKTFLGNSPWLANIKAVRSAVDDKLLSKLSPHDFLAFGNTLVPREAVSTEVQAVVREAIRSLPMPASFAFSREDLDTGLPTFKTQVKPTDARITGVGFFDRVHGQMGVSQFKGIELHPILRIEWL